MQQTVEQIRSQYDQSNGQPFYTSGRFAVVNCSFKEARTGSRFAVVELRDGTGSLTARCFESSLIDELASVGAVDANLKVDEFNSAMSCVLNSYDKAALSDDDVLSLAGLNVDVHKKRIQLLEGWLDECDSSPYGEVLRALFSKDGTWKQFCLAPAAVRLHHAEPGGLVRHLVEVGKAGLALLDSTGDEYDKPYFLAGVFLHDIGKLDTYTTPPTITYTAQGQMGEHQVWSTFRLAKACSEVAVSASIEAKLVHIIEQAHGAYRHAEWQDPLGAEVKALASADFFSSKLGLTDRERTTGGLLSDLELHENTTAVPSELF